MTSMGQCVSIKKWKHTQAICISLSLSRVALSTARAPLTLENQGLKFIINFEQ